MPAGGCGGFRRPTLCSRCLHAGLRQLRRLACKPRVLRRRQHRDHAWWSTCSHSAPCAVTHRVHPQGWFHRAGGGQPSTPPLALVTFGGAGIWSFPSCHCGLLPRASQPYSALPPSVLSGNTGMITDPHDVIISLVIMRNRIYRAL